MTPKIYTDVVQGEAEWHQLRCGLITASDYKVLFAEGTEVKYDSSTGEAI